MSEILKVLNRKSVELKSEVVELGLIDDFNSYLDSVKNMDKVLQKTLSSADKVWREWNLIEDKKADAFASLSNNTEDAESMVKEIEKRFLKVASAAKELGVDPKSVKGINEALKIVENMEDNIRQSNQILPDLKK